MVHRIKHLVFQAARTHTFSQAVKMFDRWETRRANMLRVLTYHRVDEAEACAELDPLLLSATPTGFVEQMEHLAEHFVPVSLAQVIAAVRQAETLPHRSVLVTFDDAYRCFSTHAWPVMKRLQIPCVMFVPTAFPNQPHHNFWWDRIHQAIHEVEDELYLQTELGSWSLKTVSDRAQCVRDVSSYIMTQAHERAQEIVKDICRKLGCRTIPNQVMSWSQLRHLANDGVVMAPHTRNHPLLNQVSREQAREEIRDSIHDLETETGQRVPAFSYPVGAHEASLEDVLHAEGIDVAFTTRRGINDLRRANPLQLRRINVGRFTPTSLLHAQMLTLLR
ncbi:MAG: polysaccharide deacetylase family protein [Pirellulales bacterium]|nr:polysaccharide deacetylase family protein [Pirellulales bacterium]